MVSTSCANGATAESLYRYRGVMVPAVPRPWHPPVVALLGRSVKIALR